ncbi:hypothetical protein P153DRAFT_369468 [Dothidotthia symphoricarpi CBS 119687]|uniref:Uncharacterized protein n=1 Tax=Dothidotthia symphoricarpi CBS 119687 TaxID=1392245 RepID=A0A6A6A4M2_9PLEO|nr:uncharacterized protein P153DRAFT_369468 [Dothidotthia symphoricarpi CBS 119687]KAF2126113.1 hypothetical protein P153DRAFT_369468 [Dothidotthia symphoricarpi CBS 119687]
MHARMTHPQLPGAKSQGVNNAFWRSGPASARVLSANVRRRGSRALTKAPLSTVLESCSLTLTLLLLCCWFLIRTLTTCTS